LSHFLVESAVKSAEEKGAPKHKAHRDKKKKKEKGTKEKKEKGAKEKDAGEGK
jgi:hypothetical protein